MAVIVAPRRPDGLRDLIVVELDPVEAGIAEVWGEAGLTDDELEEALADFAGRNGAGVEPLDPSIARALVAAGADYARRRGSGPPAEYAVWRRGIGQPTARVALPLTFGPRCTACGARLRGGDIDRGGLVQGDLALCGRCGQAPRRCIGCGRSLDGVSAELTLRRGTREGKLEFVCSACARKARRGRRR
jgi:hypothetical protein